jgi:hypothetical protein
VTLHLGTQRESPDCQLLAALHGFLEPMGCSSTEEVLMPKTLAFGSMASAGFSLSTRYSFHCEV